MKHLWKLYLGVALIPIILIACSSSEDTTEAAHEPLVFSADISSVMPRNINNWGINLATDTMTAGVSHETRVALSDSELTRAPQDDNWRNMTYKNVAVKAGNSVYNYTIDSESGTLTSASPYYFLSSGNIAVEAWYPYSSSLSSFSVQADQSSAVNYEKSCLIYGTNNVKHDGTNTITFRHKTAKLRVLVNVNNSNGYLRNSTITALSIGNTYRAATVTDGTINPNGGSDKGNIVAYNSVANSTSNGTSTATFEACIIPQTAEVSLYITVGGTVYTATISSMTYAANTQYNVTVNVTGSQLIFIGGSTVAIGDYYGKFANGQAALIKNNSLAAAKTRGATPIAVVFSTTTTSTEQANGWNYGQAMALYEQSECVWNKTNVDEESLPNLSETSKILADKDGYKNTHAVANNPSQIGGYTAENYPAIYNVLHFDNTILSPTTSSSWYIPSSGQWYDIAVKLGLADENVYDVVLGNGIRWTNKAMDINNAINQYVSNAKGVYTSENYIQIAQYLYYTSTEFTSSCMFQIANESKWNNGSFYIDGHDDVGWTKTGPKCIRPAISF